MAWTCFPVLRIPSRIAGRGSMRVAWRRRAPLYLKVGASLRESIMGEHAAGQSREEEISAREAYARLAAHGSAALLIDVRESWEYQPRRAQGAVNIPLSQFMQRF